MCNFRTLTADEVELRVAQCAKRKDGTVWAQYLIYKDARVDQRILDETVGSLRWKKSYEVIEGRLYCTVSVYNEELKEWISKQDVGTESNTEKEKGQASDAFKRACSNWGIGRELYSAPDIYITLNEDEYVERDGRPIPKSKLFSVQSLEVDEQSRKITGLTIVDRGLNVRFSYPAGVARKTKREPAVKTTNVERKKPSEGQLVSMAKRIAAGEDLTSKIQTNFLMGQQDWMRLDELIKQYSESK